MMSWRQLVVVAVSLAGLLADSAQADIRSWYNGQTIIPFVELKPGIDLSGHRTVNFPNIPLSWAGFFGDLTKANFEDGIVDNAHFGGANLTGANFTDANLTDASFNSGVSRGTILKDAILVRAKLTRVDLANTNLSGADFTGAVITEAKFGSNSELTPEQLYSTGSYTNKNLSGIELWNKDLTGWDFQKQRLTNAYLSGTALSNANLSQASLVQTYLQSTTLSNADLSDANLTNAYLDFSILNNAKLAGSNLTGASLNGSSLRAADLTGAIIKGARFGDVADFTANQLYSTQSYLTKDLAGISLWSNDLSGWDFHNQNLANARLSYAKLVDANLMNANLMSTSLVGANLIGADTRGALNANLSGAILKNTVLPDGQLKGLKLAAGDRLTIRDDDGVGAPVSPSGLVPRLPIAVNVQDQFAVSDGGTLQLLFGANAWDSTVRFQPGIPVQLGGKLDLAFSEAAPLAPQSGRTFKLFDWTGVIPEGQFTVDSLAGTVWDTSLLYTTGEVKLLGISGDLDHDQDVDSHDLLDFLSNWTGSNGPEHDKTWQDGDSDTDGDVDSADMLVFLSQWTGDSAVAISTAASVPEPERWGLPVITATCMLVAGIRRRSSRFHVRLAAFLVFVVCVGTCCNDAVATIIQGQDTRYPGTTNTTIDTATGLVWLDWTATVSQSYDTVRSELVPGGQYEGWRYATGLEISTLIRDMGLVYKPDATGWATEFGSSGSNPSVVKSIKYLGQTWRQYSYRYHEWHSGVEAMYGEGDIVDIGVFDDVNLVSYVGIYRGRRPPHAPPSPMIGHALVRSIVPLPEPSSLTMMLVLAPALRRFVRGRSRR